MLREGVIVQQRIFNPFQKYEDNPENPGEKIESSVKEFIVNKHYGCSVAVVNTTDSRLDLDILCEIPEGAIPVYNLDYSQTFNVQLSSFNSKTIEYFFYFASPGEFQMYSATVAKSQS